MTKRKVKDFLRFLLCLMAYTANFRKHVDWWVNLTTKFQCVVHVKYLRGACTYIYIYTTVEPKGNSS